MGRKPREGGNKVGDGTAADERRAWPVELRIQAARAVVDDRMTFTEVSKTFGVPITTISEWARRYRLNGVKGLVPVPKMPEMPPRPKRGTLNKAVADTKRENPEWGTRRIRDTLSRFETLGVSESTVRRILHEEGLLEKREPPREKPQPEPKRFERAEPNQLWQSDLFTFLLRRHERIYVAAFLDDHSRYLVSLALAHHQKSALVMEALVRGIADHGAPREILTDQGRQYTAWRGETDFEEELRRNGIRHVKSRPHHPQTCGKIERFWKTMWDEFLSRTVFADFADCQRRIALFVKHYNFQRPHQALAGMTPADRFFRAAPHVRDAIERGVVANTLRLAKEQPQRKPFYLVGRLGDLDLSITATGAGISVKLGDVEQQIPLPKEEPDGTQASRWNAGRSTEEESLPADSEVAPEERGPGRDREGAMLDGAVGALGREAGERRDPRGEGVSRDVLPAGDAGVERDVVRALATGQPGRDPRSVDARAANRGARSEGVEARAGEAPRGASALHDEEGDPAGERDDLAGTGTAAEVGLPQLDDEWEESFASLEDEGPVERDPLDPDDGWRGRAVKWERKLSGGDERRDPEGEEEPRDEEEDVYAEADDRPGNDGAIQGDPRRDLGSDHGERRSPQAGRGAQPLPDADAQGSGSDGDGDRAEAWLPSDEAGEAGGDGSGARASAEGQRATAASGRHDRQDAGDRERLPEGAHPADGAPATDESDNDGDDQR